MPLSVNAKSASFAAFGCLPEMAAYNVAKAAGSIPVSAPAA